MEVLPAFRPDKAMSTDPQLLTAYVKKLEAAGNVSISTFDEYLSALKGRHDYFASVGCRVSDHGLDHLFSDDFTEQETKSTFKKLLAGQVPDEGEQLRFKSAMLYHFATWDHEKGWVQQFHVGALRNANSRKLKELGPDTGWDSIGGFSQAKYLAKFLDSLDKRTRWQKR